MDYNKDEAYRAKEIAEKKFDAKDLGGAKRLALKAQQLYPSLEGLSHMMAVLDVHTAAENKVNGQTDWYGILQVDLVAEEAVIKKQYRKLALLLHPDKNKCAGAEEAFKLIGEAWGVLSDKVQRSLYDHKRNLKSQPQVKKRQRTDKKNPPAPTNATNGCYETSSKLHTFWTACPFCYTQYEFSVHYLNLYIVCPHCQKPFMAFHAPRCPTNAAATQQGRYNEQSHEAKAQGNWCPGKENEVPKNQNQEENEAPHKNQKVNSMPDQKENEMPNGMPNQNQEENEAPKKNQKKNEAPKRNQKVNSMPDQKENKMPNGMPNQNQEENEAPKKNQKENEVPRKFQSKKHKPDKFDRSAFDRLFAGVNRSSQNSSKRTKIEVN